MNNLSCHDCIYIIICYGSVCSIPLKCNIALLLLSLVNKAMLHSEVMLCTFALECKSSQVSSCDDVVVKVNATMQDVCVLYFRLWRRP